jgi:hypothetical protein
MIDLAPLVLKTVPLKFCGAELRLDLSHALFSSFDIDVGTRLLLKAAGKDEALKGAKRVLDMGSGVGVIGLAVAASHPESFVEARDRDLLACAFTERNRAGNRVANLAVAPGLLAQGRLGPLTPLSERDLGGVDSSYDYILSNLPAKAGAPVLEAFFHDAARRLAPEGHLAFVIVKPLQEAAEAWFAASGFELVSSERGAGHKAYVLKLASAPEPTAEPQASAPSADGAEPRPELDFSGLDLSVYVRSHGRFKSASASYEASGFWGLPNFDTLGFEDCVAADLSERCLAGSLVRDVLILNPGPGHLALWLARRLSPERLTAASRDLLALAATGANLAAFPGRKPAYRPLSSLSMDALAPASFDFFAAFPDIVPEYDWINPLWSDAARLLKAGASFLLVAPPTELFRAEKRRPSGFSLVGEKRKRGAVAAMWRRNM